MATSIYEYKVPSVEGKEIDLGEYKGKKLMLVNTASECMFTPQYQQLQEMFTAFGDQVEIIAFPSNDFGAQEPGSHEQISAFCRERFGVTFPIAEKIKITGPDAHPLYQWLTSKERNGVMNAEIDWNFHKFVVDEEGTVVAHFPSSVEPADEKVLSALGV